MSGTQEMLLGEIVKLNPVWKGTSTLDDETVDFVPMSAVFAECSTATATEYRSLQDVKKGYTSFSDGDVLLAKITPCFENGKIAQVRLKNRFGFGSTEFHVLRVDANKLDARYLVHFLRRDQIRVDGERKMTGSGGQRRVPKHYIELLRIPLPPLPEQRRIAAILDQADALRAKRREALAQLDSLTQSIFLEMFGDPVSNAKGWPISNVGNFSELQGGLQVTTARKDLPLEMPYLRVANVYRGHLNLSEIKTIRATDTEVSRTTLARNDLLVVEGHGNSKEIGRSALWTGEIAPCIHQNHIIRVRFDATKMLPIFACEYLNSTGGRQHLMREGKTTTGLNTISVSNVRATPISVPPMPLQVTFAERVDAIKSLKDIHQTALAAINTLFASLQHRAFRGEL